ncbi:MAG: hypothetical protein QNL99_00485, partial [SAR86 cluster bacterium]
NLLLSAVISLVLARFKQVIEVYAVVLKRCTKTQKHGFLKALSASYVCQLYLPVMSDRYSWMTSL